MIRHGSLGPSNSPYELRDDWPNVGGPQYDPYKSTSGKTASSTTINTSERTALILAVGQSLISNENNAGGSLHTPTNAAKVDNLNPYTGAMWRGKDPWIGCAGQNSSWLGKFADAAINSGMFARVIIEPIGIGGRPPIEWNRSGRYHHRVMVGLKRIRDLIGAEPLANAFPMVFWMMQGATAESPVDGHVTTYANYVSDFGETHSLMVGLGIDWPWYVSRTTYVSGVTKSEIRQAQLDICNGTTIRQGPDTDTVTAGSRVDGVHFTAAGCTTVANLWHTAIDPYY